MARHGDFCLPPKVLVRALIGLLVATFVLFMGGWFTAWFAPMPMTMARDLTLAAIVLLAPAYFVKVLLQHGGEEGTPWSQIAGCLSSAMIALGSLGLAWGVGNAFPRCVAEQDCVFAPQDDDDTRLYLYPNGCKIERRPYRGREWRVEVRGEVGEDVPPHYFGWSRPLRERLAYLVAHYPTWHRHEAPRAWRERYAPEPTLEALLAWGKKRGEWSLLEEPLVPRLLREAWRGGEGNPLGGERRRERRG